MKLKIINRILTAKHRSWCASIEDEAVRKIAEDNAIITGGAIVSLLQNEHYNDVDFYLKTPEAAFAIAQYYVKKLLENPPPAFKDDPAHKVEVYAVNEPPIPDGQEAKRVTGMIKGPQPARVRIVVKSAGIAGETEQKDYQYFEGAPQDQQAGLTEAYVDAAMGRAEGEVTDTTEPDIEEGGLGYEQATAELDDIDAKELDEDKPKTKVKDEPKKPRFRVLFVTSNAITLSDKAQIVIRFQGEPAQIHEKYDYKHCTAYWTSWEQQVKVDADTLLCIMNKELRYVGSLYPLCSVIRLRKFLSRGWTINAGQIVKMLWQVNQLNLSDPVVLEDQLVGVDSAYFAQVITALRERMEKRAAAGESCEIDGTYLCTLLDKVFQ